MKSSEFFQRACRRLVLLPSLVSLLRKWSWRMRGAQIGRGTRLPPALVTWPHQVKIGRDCILQRDIFFNYDHYWTAGPSIIVGDRVFIGRAVEFNVQGRIEIGDDALIAAGCTLVDHDHGIAPGSLIRTQPSLIRPIKIERGAWIGAGAVILKGVEIGEGAIIGAGSVVTKSIPAHEIWCGVPARKVGERASCHEKLMTSAREDAARTD